MQLRFFVYAILGTNSYAALVFSYNNTFCSVHQLMFDDINFCFHFKMIFTRQTFKREDTTIQIKISTASQIVFPLTWLHKTLMVIYFLLLVAT